MRTRIGAFWAGCVLAVALGSGCDQGSMQSSTGDGGGVGDGAVLEGGAGETGILPQCPDGTDRDGDGYGQGCPAGNDCNDSDPSINEGAQELCDGVDNDCDLQTDEGVLNECGTCDPGCAQIGLEPFETDPAKDPNVKDADGVGPDANGDLVLDKTKKNFNYMWIANSLDTWGASQGCIWATDASYNPSLNPYCRGTVSKIDTVSLKEVARYFTITCHSTQGATECVDLHGQPIVKEFPNAPSRTAVDYNFDVWVANRAFAGQPSATKIANELGDCIDRNNNKVIDTSKDQNGDGKIEVDCNGDTIPDDASTICTGAFAGMNPEFLGEDDECVLFTVNYASTGDMGRSICLDRGIDFGASNAWVGTFNRSGNNAFFKIDGNTGQLSGPFDLPAGHNVYGCSVDGQGILWSANINGTLNFLNTVNPQQVGPLLIPPDTMGAAKFYGITMDDLNHVWLGGYDSATVWRYKPVRTSFADLATGTWTGLKVPTALASSSTRGIAADNRGKIWVADTSGYVWRVEQSVADGLHDLSGSTSYWQTNGTNVIGVGVDFAGHIWAISYNNNVAARLDVDSQGDPILPATFDTKFVEVGQNPYTYSDFTGFGLQNFTRPQGRYLYQLQPCAEGIQAEWKQVSWKATTPAGTSISVRVRSGDSEASLGNWFGPYMTSPALLGKNSATPLDPNPAAILQVEFILKTTYKDISPILHDFSVSHSCSQTPE